MGRAAVVAGLVLTAAAAAGYRPPPVAEPPAPAVPTPEELRRAAEQVLSSDCGNSVLVGGYQEHARMLRDAGPAVLPVLTEMVADERLSVWFVGRAADTASAFALSKPFRQALRGRRDDPRFGHDHGARLAVFDYFAAFGDATDLAWMVRAAGTLDEARRPYADKPIGVLQRRLAQP